MFHKCLLYCHSVEITNKMQPCNRINYSTVHYNLLVISTETYYDARIHEF